MIQWKSNSAEWNDKQLNETTMKWKMIHIKCNAIQWKCNTQEWNNMQCNEMTINGLKWQAIGWKYHTIEWNEITKALMKMQCSLMKM